MFLLISNGHIGGPKRFTIMASPYKALQRCVNGSANNSETVGNKDLRLGKIIYILVFSNISFSRLLPLDGFQLIFLLCDSENDLMTGASTVTIPEVFANLNLAQFPGLLFSKVADLPSRHPCKED